MKGAIIMWESLKMGFYQTFILEDNYQYFVKGLGTTLTVTIFALIIGVIIGVLVAIIRSAHDQQPEKKKGLPLKILKMCIRDRKEIQVLTSCIPSFVLSLF